MTVVCAGQQVNRIDLGSLMSAWLLHFAAAAFPW